MSLRTWLTGLRKLWSNQPGPKDHLSSYQPPTLTRSEGLSQRQEELSQPLDSLLSPEPVAQRLYWCNFRDHNGLFLGVVICYGKTPGSAANWAITTGLVESENASIVPIPPEQEARFFLHANILLSEGDITKFFPDIPMVKQEKA